MTEIPLDVTYSSLGKFKNCPRSYRYRCVDEIVPIKFMTEPLTMGTIIHAALETWFLTRSRSATVETITMRLRQACWPLTSEKAMKIYAMIDGYIRHWGIDDWHVEAVEDKFDVEFDPWTRVRGKVDARVMVGDLRYLVEHKSAAYLNEGYLARLQGDFQSLTYSYFYPKFSGATIQGVIYDVLEKPTIKLRRSELDNPQAYRERLDEQYQNPEKFHRQFLHFDIHEFTDFEAELAVTLDHLRECTRRHQTGDPYAFSKNTQFCWNWNRPCPYFKLCRSFDSPIIRENFYKHEPKHSELLDTELTDF